MEKEMKKDVKWEQVLFCCSNCSIPADSDPNWVCPLCGFPSCSAKLLIFLKKGRKNKMKKEMNENEMTVSEIMSKALFLARYEPERIEEYAKVFYPGAWRIEEYQKVFYPGAWRQIGRELARYNPSFLEKYAEHFDNETWQEVGAVLAQYHPDYLEKLTNHFLRDDWDCICDTLFNINPKYIKILKQYMPVEIYNKYQQRRK